jgi:CHAD domain-containing protein
MDRDVTQLLQLSAVAAELGSIFDLSIERRLDALASNLALEELAEEAVHRTRIASRRLRELLPLLQVEDGPDQKLAKLARTITKGLGRVRELDVLTRVLDELSQNPKCSHHALRCVAARVAEARELERHRLADARLGTKVARLTHRLRSHLKSVRQRPIPNQSSLSAWALETRVAARAAALQSAIDCSGALYAPGPLHRVRIAVKKLRYATELLVEIRRPGLESTLATLKSAQDVLGRLHDLDVLLAWIREVQATLNPPEVTDWRALTTITRLLEDDCRHLHGRYMRDRERLIAIAAHLADTRQQDRQKRGSAGDRRAS